MANPKVVPSSRPFRGSRLRIMVWLPRLAVARRPSSSYV
jgi:hypothetical protein